MNAHVRSSREIRSIGEVQGDSTIGHEEIEDPASGARILDEDLQGPLENNLAIRYGRRRRCVPAS